MIHLCRLDDAEAQGFALQSLELLAIESPEMICAQQELLPILLTVPHQTVDPKRQTLAAKLLLYYCEQREVRVWSAPRQHICKQNKFSHFGGATMRLCSIGYAVSLPLLGLRQ